MIPLTPGAQLDVAGVSAQIASALPNADQATIDALTATLGQSAAGPPRSGWGLILSDRAQANDYLFDTGFPTFGNEDVKYFGIDLGSTYYIQPELSVFANYSYVSENVWTPEDLGEENPNFEYFLNSPTHRANFGISYLQKEGFYGRLAGSYVGEFEGKQGDGRVFTGLNPARTIWDLSGGYRFNVGESKIDLGLSVNNLFDTEYQYFSHLPTIQRLAMVNLKASF